MKSSPGVARLPLTFFIRLMISVNYGLASGNQQKPHLGYLVVEIQSACVVVQRDLQ
jgi:hypothetical protein